MITIKGLLIKLLLLSVSSSKVLSAELAFDWKICIGSNL